MNHLKIVAVVAALLATISTVQCSVIGPAIAPLPAIRYTHVAPPSVLPFSAQVSTFTRNLNVFDAPYAAGVFPGHPAIIQRAFLPSPVAPFAPAPVLPAPHAHTPIFPPPVVARASFPAPASWWPGPVSGFPYPAGLVAPYARSVHPVAPAPLLG